MPVADIPGNTATSVELVDRPATEQLELLKVGDLSAVELLAACRDRALLTEPVVNALISVDWDRATDRARALDSDRSFCDGAPLRGLVTAHKDLLDTAGMVTTYGSTVYADHIPTVNNPLVDVLASAGVVVIGKTNTPEFGAGSHTFNSVHGVTRNPWDPARSAGGSSGGAAAALACGSLCVADGSDLGGSIRNPASFCGIVGFRPSSGTVPGTTSADHRITMPSNGPMGRCVSDVRILLTAMTGGSAMSPRVETPRVLFSVDHGDLPVAPAVARLVEQAARQLEAAGWRIESGDLPLPSVDRCFETLRSLAYFLMLPGLLGDSRVKETVRFEIARGMALGEDEIRTAVADEILIRTAFDNLFESVDLVLTPTSQVPPFPVGAEWVADINGVGLAIYTDWMRSCSRLTVPGGPSISLPAGFTDKGLPIGIQLSGQRGADAYLLAAAELAEAVLGTAPRPPIDVLSGFDPTGLPPGPIT
jgi:amidase|tara:strand:- start:250 stop:1683 length:1434 start_codon:yes stop_codon:yes gene_type:complete